VALERGIGLRGALSVNAIAMVGIGPLITIPLVLGALHGPLSLAGWIGGALLAICDGLVWAELGARVPGSGGTYGYVRRAFGRGGGFFAFLFAWQTIFSAPLLLASGYIGFANYAGYLLPALTQPVAQKLVAIGVGALTLAVLYRRIGGIAKIGIALAIVTFATLAITIVAAYVRFDPARAFALDPHDALWPGLRAGLGAALVIAMYDYVGYGSANAVGDEVRDPSRTLPRAILGAIGLIGALYVLLQTGVLGALDWHTIAAAPDGTVPALGQHVASAVVERAFGVPAALALTVLVLVTAFASTFGNLLAFSRIPFAAARDGQFPAFFAHLDPKRHIPDVALVTIGVLALPACLFSLDAVINALVAAGILVQSIAQIAALAFLRRREPAAAFRIPLYPLPALVALIGWGYLFIASGTSAMLYAGVTIGAGAAVYAIGWRRAHPSTSSG
jgi:amino acid transporter